MNDDFLSRILLAIHGISEDDLRRSEGPGKWSIFDVLAHLTDFEQLTATRLRQVLALDTPPLASMDQVAFAASHHGEPLAPLLEQLSFFHRMNADLLAGLTPAQRSRIGAHPEFGPLTIHEIEGRAQRHGERHLAQIERIKEKLGLTASELPQNAAESGRAGAEPRAFGDVRVYDLWRGGAKRALQVEFPAGAQWPGLDHHVPGPEEVFVVRGDFEDDGTTYGPGTFLHYPAGSSHSPRSTSGCTLFVFYPEG